MSNPHRCAWAESDPLLRDYHDQEWGVPEYDSRALWELLMLEGFQAGLAWITVLRKREAFRKAFHSFEPRKVAAFSERDITRLLADPDPAVAGRVFAAMTKMVMLDVAAIERAAAG